MVGRSNISAPEFSAFRIIGGAAGARPTPPPAGVREGGGVVAEPPGTGESVPPLCERCWFPVLPGQPRRRYHARAPGAPFAPLWVCHEHRGRCPAPSAD